MSIPVHVNMHPDVDDSLSVRIYQYSPGKVTVTIGGSLTIYLFNEQLRDLAHDLQMATDDLLRWREESPERISLERVA